jgi:hypothetical protein
LLQLLKFYNPTYFIKIKEQTTFTGGITEDGRVLSCGDEIIRQKVKAVFFSEITTFIIPKCEETHARDQLLELQKDYPERKLKLIHAEDIHDILNRRDVVDIRKQKLVVRTGKFVRKNWVSAVVTVLLAILFGYLFVVDWDDNPAILENNGTTLYVKNKNGKILWTRKRTDGKNIISESVQKIVDINSDGINEILLTGEPAQSLHYGEFLGRIICLNFMGEKI